jgi:iron complex outermembrane receptor protein
MTRTLHRATPFAAVVSMGAACGLALAPLSAAAQEAATDSDDLHTLPTVYVEDDAPPPNRTTLVPGLDSVFPAADAGEALMSVPGVSVGRMGGHGLEPFIRGQSQTRITIVDDGAVIHGGCPNRMDPPTAYMNMDSIDALEVDKGYATVRNGPGGPGGTVRSTRDVPVFAPDKPYAGSVSTGLDSNAWAKTADGSVRAGTEWGYVRADAHYADANSYVDGDGDTVRSAYSAHGARTEVGLTPTPDDTLRIGFQYDRIEDALFAGAGMDSPLSETAVGRLSYDHRTEPGGVIEGVKASFYGGAVDHVMDNYSLRTRTGNVMQVDSDSNTFGGAFSVDGDWDATAFTVGADLQVNNRDAVRYMGARSQIGDSSRIQSYSWPDITIAQVGLYAEADHPLAADRTLRVGLRFDRVDVSSAKADRVAIAPAQSANTLYANYYGVRAEDRAENNVGGVVRYEAAIRQGLRVSAGLSRSVRTADATERGLAQNNNTASNRWVGNPGIEPEKHHQADVGATAAFSTWSAEGSIYYDRVSDFILRDRARGQDGILLNDNATIYRNVDATLAGFEASGRYRPAPNWVLSAQMAYTYGENEEDGRPLAQIPPFEYGIGAEYRRNGAFMAGVRVRGALQQDRADIGAQSSGLDTAKTGRYTVVDLYGDVLALDPVTVSMGVTNLFDAAYANHLSRANAFDPVVEQVNEPGRTIFLRVHADF